jgi:hypothetical protein
VSLDGGPAGGPCCDRGRCEYKGRNFVASRRNTEQRLHDNAQAYRQLAAQLAETGYLWPGSISEQRLTPGKPTCACHQDCHFPQS